jgi:O-acetylserine/cysteine efflux transporter
MACPAALQLPPMSLRDFSLFVLICLVWAFNTVAAKIVVTDLHVPPLFFGMLRSVVIALAVCPWLLPMPRPYWRMVVVGVLMGGGGFALFFVGLKTASPSAASIVGQVGVPFATLLSVLVLGEGIRWKRGAGIGLTLLGVLIVMFDPQGFDASVGLVFVVASAFGGAVGTIMMKQMEGIRPLRFQAWVGFSSTLLLMPLSAAFETNQFASAYQAGWPLLALVLYSGLVVSVLGHTTYYGLIQRYEATLIAPLTLMSPLMTIVLGIWITGDHFDIRMALGTVLALIGVFIIAIRPNRAMPRAVVIQNAPE